MIDNDEIKKEVYEMFQELGVTDSEIFYTTTEAFMRLGGLEFIIIHTSPTCYSQYEKDKYFRIEAFYNELKESGDFKKARKAGGLNSKEANHYLNFFNMAFEKHGLPLLHKMEIKFRKRRNSKLIKEDKFEQMLELFDVANVMI